MTYMAETKTNAMRILDRAKIKYEMHTYPHTEGEAVDGMNVAKLTLRYIRPLLQGVLPIHQRISTFSLYPLPRSLT